MYLERQDRFPKGTYKVLTCRQGGNALYSAVNLHTGKQSCCQNLWDLVKGIEHDLADNGFPQNCVQYRTWSQGGGHAGEDSTNVMSLEDAKKMLSATGPTFLLKVLFRQNATWQGTIQWLEGRQTRQYRSINELLWLIDEAMELPPAQPDEPTA